MAAPVPLKISSALLLPVPSMYSLKNSSDGAARAGAGAASGSRAPNARALTRMNTRARDAGIGAVTDTVRRPPAAAGTAGSDDGGHRNDVSHEDSRFGSRQHAMRHESIVNEMMGTLPDRSTLPVCDPNSTAAKGQ